VLFTTQYYRPPFPDRRRWRDDLRDIKSTGFDAIYVSAVWSWIEPAPGSYQFDDLDELFELAEAAHLGVIVNVWAEINPLWIHRHVPGSELVDHLGRKVVSSQLAYMQFGLTPGGCTDHPEVRALSGAFIEEVARRYAGSPALRVWDCWNEIRWLSQADGFVCYCDHTVAAFRNWLRDRYGDLDGLNAAWRRRYRSWDDVLPVKLPTRTYTDALAFQLFLADRARRDLRWRYDLVRAVDAERPIVAHAAFPSAFSTGEFFEFEQPLARGNDWELSEQVDGYGASHFPAWIHTDPCDYAARLEAARSATGAKTYWVSELQGGAAGHGLQALEPVSAERQARWVWNAVARGAKGVNFWCWCDEVFGRESGGFGITGEDGHAEARLAELSRIAGLLHTHTEELDAYRPDPATIGVVFEPACYSLDWAATMGGGLAAGPPRFQAGHSLLGYLRALERLQLGYDVVEAGRTDELDRYRLIVLPWPLIVRPSLAESLLAWVRAGGTLLVEAGLDAFDTEGLYRYAPDRPFAHALGVRSSGRRPVTTDAIDCGTGRIKAAGWIEPLTPDGSSFSTCRVGDGTVVSLGTFAGLGYRNEPYDGFEEFVDGLAMSAGALPALRCDTRDGSVVQWRTGAAFGSRLLFVVNEGDKRRVTFTGPGLSDGATAVDLAHGGCAVRVTDGSEPALELELRAGGYHVLRIS
jgi:beta-galactosidase